MENVNYNFGDEGVSRGVLVGLRMAGVKAEDARGVFAFGAHYQIAVRKGARRAVDAILASAGWTGCVVDTQEDAGLSISESVRFLRAA